MIGTIGRLRQSKISKICAFILSLVVGLSSFLLLSPAAYADNISLSYTGFTKDSSYSVSPFIPVGEYSFAYGSAGEVYQGYVGWYDIDVNYNFVYQVSPTYDINRFYSGFIQSNFTIFTNLNNVNITDYTYKLGLISYELHGFGDVIFRAISESAVTSQAPQHRQWSAVVYNFYENIKFPEVATTRFAFTLHFRLFVYAHNYVGNTYPAKTEPTVSISDSNSVSYFRCIGTDSEVNLLSELLNSTDSIDNTVGNIYSSINSAASQAHTDSAAEKAAINSAASQAHSDSQTINNNILHDSSGSSQNSANIQQSFEAANQAADTAIDSAVHNYDNQLDQVENVNFDNFFTSQNAAVTFWRDVGEFVLNSSNLGYIASGMIIVTLIGLFVFLLRL